jgi:phosphatidylserine decarboxylase
VGFSYALTLFFSCLGLMILSVLAGILSLFVTYFFRDPERSNGAPQGAVLSPADGRILKIEHMEAGGNPLGEAAVKISIFMSVFNVHVNRVPAKGMIERITYHPGKFFAANLDKASEQNEKNRVILQTPDYGRIAFVQIAGLIARRIACWVSEGDPVQAGQRFGLIRFGSRLEVYLPQESRITARQGQKVRAGETVIGYLS